METKELLSAPPQLAEPGEANESNVEAFARAAERYAEKAHADGTLERYREHWAAFTAWCESQSLCALPAEPKTGYRLPSCKKVR